MVYDNFGHFFTSLLRVEKSPPYLCPLNKVIFIVAVCIGLGRLKVKVNNLCIWLKVKLTLKIKCNNKPIKKFAAFYWSFD